MARREAGFTLLEVMVALVIAGLALGVLFQGSLGGLRTAGSAGQVQEALSRAQSRLAALGRAGGLVPGTAEGEDGGGFHWRTQVTQLDVLPPGQDRTLPRAALFALEVSVTAEGGPGVRLRTERLGTAPPAPP